MKKYFTQSREFMNNTVGVTLIEYVILAALIILVAITTISTLGNNVKTELNNVASNLTH